MNKPSTAESRCRTLAGHENFGETIECCHNFIVNIFSSHSVKKTRVWELLWYWTAEHWDNTRYSLLSIFVTFCKKERYHEKFGFGAIKENTFPWKECLNNFRSLGFRKFLICTNGYQIFLPIFLFRNAKKRCGGALSWYKNLISENFQWARRVSSVSRF